MIQILTNLLNNAAKYTNPGGQVSLSVTTQNGSAIIRVKDNGIGIALHRRQAIFDMFNQGDPEESHVQSGLGIGLSLVKSLAEMHEGSITVHSDGQAREVNLSCLFHSWSNRSSRNLPNR